MKNTQSTYAVGVPAGGLGDGAENVAACENLWAEDRLLKTRPGFVPTDSTVYPESRTDYLLRGWTPTDTLFEQDGTPCRVWDFLDSDGDSVHTLHPHLMQPDGTPCALPTVAFYRTAAELFYYPSHWYYLSAAPTDGCGLYLFVTLTAEDAPTDYRIFELSADRSEWSGCQSFYRPVIYKNGRGTQYDDAAQQLAVVEDLPRAPESLNRLSGEFSAYYSSDSYSDTFLLPVVGLDAAAPVVCRVYENAATYTEWNIPANTASVTVAFKGNSITLTCDRTNGALHFSKSGQAYGVPMMRDFKKNNIRIIAAKTVPHGRESVLGAKCGRTVGDRLFVGGADATPDTVCEARVDCPLYFPEESAVSLGPDAGTVCRFAVQNNRVAALCENEIAVLSVRRGSRARQNDVLIDSESFETAGDALRVDKRYPVGVFGDGSAAAVCGGRLIFLAADRTVRMLRFAHTTYESRASILSEAVTEHLESADFSGGVFACEWLGRWLLFFGNQVLVADVRNLTDSNEKAAWFCWMLPARTKFSGGFSVGGKLRLGAVLQYSTATYLGELTGTVDREIRYQGGTYSTVELPIPYRFLTVGYDLGLPFERKMVDALYLTAATANTLAVDCGGRYFAQPLNPVAVRDGCLQTVHLHPFLRFVRTVRFAVSGSGAAAFGGFTIRFRTLETR